MPIDEQQLIKFLDSRHCGYKADLWRFYRDFAHGGDRVFCQRYLHRHPREDETLYQARLKRVSYPNFLKSLLRIIPAFVFRYPVSRQRGEQIASDDYLQDVDLLGHGADDFMQMVARDAIISGLEFVLVDTTAQAPASSRAEEIASGSRPYWVRIGRECLLNFALDHYGKPYWALLRVPTPDRPDPFSQKDGRVYFQLWTRNAWTRYWAEPDSMDKIAKAGVDAEGANSLGEVPIVPVYGDELATWCGESWISDCAWLAKDIFNMESLREENNRLTAYEMLGLEGSPDDAKEMLVGPSVIFTYRGTRDSGVNPPGYIAPSGRGSVILSEVIREKTETLYKLLHQRLISSSASADGASGTSKQTDFDQSTSIALSGLASNLESAENRLHVLTARYLEGGEPVVATYPTMFDPDLIEKELARLQMLSDVSAPPTLRQHVLSGIAQQIMGSGATPEQVRQVRKEIAQGPEGSEPSAGVGQGESASMQPNQDVTDGE